MSIRCMKYRHPGHPLSFLATQRLNPGPGDKLCAKLPAMNTPGLKGQHVLWISPQMVPKMAKWCQMAIKIPEFCWLFCRPWNFGVPYIDKAIDHPGDVYCGAVALDIAWAPNRPQAMAVQYDATASEPRCGDCLPSSLTSHWVASDSAHFWKQGPGQVVECTGFHGWSSGLP